jgi:hypothetical protein
MDEPNMRMNTVEQMFCAGLGVVLLLVGVVGAITGGHDHNLIIFGINMNHNIVHLASGVLALIGAGMGAVYARGFCLAFGVIYGAVAVAGFAGVPSVMQALNINMADNFLHIAIAGSALLVGLTAKTSHHVTTPHRFADQTH